VVIISGTAGPRGQHQRSEADADHHAPEADCGVLEQLQPFLAVARLDHAVAKMGQCQAQHRPDGVVVVDEEDSSHAQCGSWATRSGVSEWNTVPAPGCLRP